MAEFYNILTVIGQNKIAAAAAGGPLVNITHMAVGDGGGAYYDPVATQTALRAERWRGSVSNVSIDPTRNNWVIVDATVPTAAGGFTIREAGIYDAAGDLIAIGKYPATYKPAPSEGSAKDLYLRMILAVSNTSAVTFTIDPALTLVTRPEYNQFTARFNTLSSQDVTLQPGVQVIQATKSAPFSLENLTGRMLVNLLGRQGGCEALGTWEANVSLLQDTTQRTSGMSSFKITLGSVDAYAGITFNSQPDHYYVVLADVKAPTGGVATLSVQGLASSGSSAPNGDFTTHIIRVKANAFFHQVRVTFSGASGSACNLDSVRVYEVSAAEYAALGSMPVNERVAKYPYVDSVKPIRNPYAIRYGVNLLPPLYEWESFGANKTITGPYNMTLTSDAASGYPLRVFIPVIPGQSYTLTAVTTGFNGQPRIGVYSYFTDAAKTRLTDRDYNQTKTASTQAAYIEVVLNNDISASSSGATTILAGTFTFRDIMLNIGSEALPFVPREDSMLALQTDLYADPLTGTNADSVFERDGQYFKATQWMRRESFTQWDFVPSTDITIPNGRRVYTTGLPVPDRQSAQGQVVTKYNGQILTFNGSANTLDSYYVNTSGTFYLVIPAADSGWGASYTPSTDEIRAYFLGWKMYDTSTSNDGTSIYNRTDNLNKGWVYRAADNSAWAGGTTTLPTTQSPAWSTPNTRFGPYELVYQLATPTAEPIVSEGQLTLNEGSNQVEVGTGIVLRELNRPAFYATDGIWMFNDSFYGSSFRHMARSILAIYKQSRRDDKAIVYSGGNQYGTIKARLSNADYDNSVSYTATYLMLDTSPVAAFVGSVPDNEKTLLADLVQDAQEVSKRVSVLENKKAEKDSPAWIALALLNSWANYGGGTYTAAFNRDSMGAVRIRGLIRNGLTTAGTILCYLPSGYRPLSQVNAVAMCSGGTTAHVQIRPDGAVTILAGGNNTWLSLDNISFLAEA